MGGVSDDEEIELTLFSQNRASWSFSQRGRDALEFVPPAPWREIHKGEAAHVCRHRRILYLRRRPPREGPAHSIHSVGRGENGGGDGGEGNRAGSGGTG